MDKRFNRLNELLGFDADNSLKYKKITVVGLGGVGSFVVEALVRCGIGNLTLIDKDNIDVTNINRQIYALESTVGKSKVELAKCRCLDINPNCNVAIYNECLNSDNVKNLIDKNSDYVIDAIDMVSAKLNLIEYCYNNNIKIISSMGTGNKLKGENIKITDLYKTNNCPLAKIMRSELRKRGIKKLKVAYSDEIVTVKKQRPASIIFVPSIAGLLISEEVIYDLLKINHIN